MTTTERPALADLADPAVLPDPYPVLAGLRDASPFAVADGALVVVGRHEDCSRILRDPRASSERNRSLLAPPELRAQRAPSFLSLDPPDHTRLRRLVSKAFGPRVIAGLEPRIRQLCDDLLDAVVRGDAEAGGGRQVEVVSQLAYPLPVRIISELLGVPAGDHSRFAGWSASLAHALQPQFVAADPASAAVAQQARLEFADYFRELIAARRARPADDLLTELIRAEDDGQRLSEAELIATCVLLLVAGHETTVGLISNAILALLRHPDQLAALRADPDLAVGAVEETLRFDAPVQLTGRVARGELPVGEVRAPDGAVLLLLLAATGRDPAVFADPDRFDIRRGAANHLAFAAGPHFCLGAPLARLEATIALQAFAARVTDPELDPAGLAYKPNLNLRGPERLVVAFSRIRPRGERRSRYRPPDLQDGRPAAMPRA
ncbi:MAG TPA: cytochrome P450 [Streptosporangiaceae bacterium]|nr:cytochrome P450 [Streptosporangiaceae bacterium]